MLTLRRILLLALLLWIPNSGSAQEPAHCMAANDAGRISLTVANNGTIGRYMSPAPQIDWFTGDSLESCLYPKDSSISYLFGGALWVGGLVGNDTLVSVGNDGWVSAAELFPDQAPFGNMVRLDTADLDAVSDEDLLAVYTDTLTEGVPPDFSGRPHIPLNVEVTQSSFSWSDTFEEDFVLLRYDIANIGDEPINDMYVGLWIDSDVGHLSLPGHASDDLFGYIQQWPYHIDGCEFDDTLNLAWIADNDGDPQSGEWDSQSARHVTGVSLIYGPPNVSAVSYNWWVSNSVSALDWGPHLQDNIWDFGTGGTGTPMGDINKYRLMGNGEIDYDQYYTAAVLPSDPIWDYPPQDIVNDISDGADIKYLISVGPFNLGAGQTVPVIFAYIGGIDLHNDPNNLDNLPTDPDTYRDNLDFTDVARSVRWARWTYDNPGVDTDCDGYYGEFVICNGDTLWVKGDGVPDYKDPFTMRLSTDNLVFSMADTSSDLPEPKKLQISSPHDPGGQSWEMTIIDGGWLTADKFTGTYPEDILISVIDDALPVGTYNALLRFFDGKAQNSPVYVNVTHFVGAGMNVGDIVVMPGDQLRVPINLYSPQPVGRFTLPLYFHADQTNLITLDSMVLNPTIGGMIIHPNDTTVVVRRDIQEPPLPDPDSAYTHVGDMYFSVDSSADEQVVMIDTTTVVVGTTTYTYTLEFLDKSTADHSFNFGKIMVGGGCCIQRGDILHDGLGPDLADVVYLLDFMFGGGPEPVCKSISDYYAEADVNGSGDQVDISDLIYLVCYLFQDGPAPVPCPL